MNYITKSGSGKDIRKMENLHILLWLIKDTCRAVVWRPGGILMIVPTMSVAFYLLVRARHIRSELYHNAAVCMWISANSVWMCGEFFNRDLRTIAVWSFATGLGILADYYLLYFRKNNATPAPSDLPTKETATI